MDRWCCFKFSIVLDHCRIWSARFPCSVCHADAHVLTCSHSTLHEGAVNQVLDTFKKAEITLPDNKNAKIDLALGRNTAGFRTLEEPPILTDVEECKNAKTACKVSRLSVMPPRCVVA